MQILIQPFSFNHPEHQHNSHNNIMASSDKTPDSMPPGDGSMPPGNPMTITHSVIDKGAEMMQSLNPIKQMSQHVCSFACYSHDMTRQIETHHYVARLNNDFLQCAVYDSDDPSARLIGIYDD